MSIPTLNPDPVPRKWPPSANPRVASWDPLPPEGPSPPSRCPQKPTQICCWQDFQAGRNGDVSGLMPQGSNGGAAGRGVQEGCTQAFFCVTRPCDVFLLPVAALYNGSHHMLVSRDTPVLKDTPSRCTSWVQLIGVWFILLPWVLFLKKAMKASNMGPFAIQI